MKKTERIAAYVATLGADPEIAHDPRYQGWFTCFNAGDYYEAHDVLEDLWLETRGPEHAFFKGLIQLAGAFVHLKKQFLDPHHPKHGTRLRPAARLFDLALANLAPFRPVHLCLDVAEVCRLCHRLSAKIAGSDFQANPWQPTRAPQLHLRPA